MSTPMETEVSSSLSALRGVWYLKIPDVPRFSGNTFRANIPRPFDYIALCAAGIVAFECKQTKNRTRFDLSNISSHQIENMARIESLGGYSYLLINIRATTESPRVNRMFALSPSQIIYWYYEQADRASITYKWLEDNTISIPRIKLPSGKYGWDLRILSPLRECSYDRGTDNTLF